ncbi:bifunctional riboflavin kinase/FAD synthetase [Psychroserpens sp. SPM9]|uniref:bifunctional riboflavin kinase/FAD synthetase n=1 Tax=Psychroserpens sp. SPM9 TaxID=2975598 RepID=UPI0021A3F875|nr:bifunctional riboflavin kinase/FAD synthetase [Psychroserpens sp. SPM9]MDG5490836.1 bifunctional riboflavin kinase/FAD synthetase [Psychroserpens sp. SPM9]
MKPKTSNTSTLQPSVITIGTFDGVHIGHQKIIERLVKTGKKNHLKSIVLTFFPHPRMVLQPDFKIQLLHTIQERQNVLKQFGLDQLVIKKFTKAFANLSARDYVKNILVDELNAKHIIIGYDHHFGKNRTANIDDLKAFGEEFGFVVEEISAQDIEDVAVSSTKIRQSLLEGAIETANAYLGYPYFITGTVIKGKGIGKTLQFPTANLDVEKAFKLIPKNGVYVIKSILDKQLVFGMMNIGTNPTFNEKKQSIEVHFFDMDKNLYDRQLKIEIISRLRDEEKFESVEQLTAQLHLDKENALAYIQKIS